VGDLRVKLVIVGGGFTGTAVARRALAAGLEVVATTRSEARAVSLRARGVTPLVSAAIDAGALAAHVDPSTYVLVALPPDGATDRAIAPSLACAAALAYVSSTAVYGGASGRVDESTAVDPGAPRAAPRLDAERTWRDAGASVVRAPGIYGPGRGMHLRLARGEQRLAGEGTNAISRVHVDDLAASLFALLATHPRPGALYVMGDLEPAPHVEVVQWLCAAMAIPMPPRAPASEIDETLRHDRRVDAARIRAALGFTPVYPTYREGFAHCLAVDAGAIDAALRR